MKRIVYLLIIFSMVFQGIGVTDRVAEASSDSIPIRWEEDHANLQFIGNWDLVEGNYSGGSSKYTTASDASVVLSFVGNSFKIIGSKGQNQGDFDIYVDGSKIKTVSLKGNLKTQQTIYQSSSLTYGSHTVRLQPTSGSQSVGMNVDAVEITVKRPPDPTQFTAVHRDGVVELKWSAVSGVKGYLIYRKIEGGSGEIALTDTPVQDLELTDQIDSYSRPQTQNYNYRIVAVGEADLLSASKSTSVKIPSNAAAVPSSVKVSIDDNGHVNLTWNPSNNAAGYSVFRSTNRSGPFNPVRPDGYEMGTQYVDTEVTQLFRAVTTHFYYNIKAVDAFGGNSGASSTVSISLSPTSGPASFTGQWNGEAVALQWSSVIGAAGYKVSKYDVNNKKYVPITSELIVKTDVIDRIGDLALSKDTSTSYIVTAVDSRGLETVATKTTVIIPKNTATTPKHLQLVNDRNKVSLAWSTAMNANGYFVYRSLSRSGPWIKISGNSLLTDTSFRDQSFADLVSPVNSQYYYVVSAVNRYGTESAKSSAVRTVKKAPVAPRQLSYAISGDTVQLQWGNVPEAIQYRVYRSDSSYSILKLIDTLPSDSPLFTRLEYEGNINNDRKVYYAISTVDSAHNESSLTKISFTLPKSTPQVPIILPITSQQQQAIITWQPAKNAVSYQIYRSASRNGNYERIGSTLSSAGTAYTDQSLESAFLVTVSNYYYAVASVNRYGFESSKSKVEMVALAPTEGPIVTTSTYSEQSENIEITWNSLRGATSYEIQRADSATNEFVTIGTSDQTRFTDQLAEATRLQESNYSYRVRALNSSGQPSLYSSPAIIVVHSNLASTPINLQAILAPTRVVSLSWGASNRSYGYNVYLQLGNGTKQLLNAQPITDTSWEYDGLQIEEILDPRAYLFEVTAINRYGTESGNSIPITLTLTPPVKPSGVLVILNGDNAQLSWQPGEDASRYQIYRSLMPEAGYEWIATNNMGENSYIDPIGMQPSSNDTVYYYRVVAQDTNGYPSRLSDAVSVTVPRNTAAIPEAPSTGLRSGQIIEVVWPVASLAEGYRVYRLDSNGVPQLIGESIESRFTDMTFSSEAIRSPITLIYQIAAINRLGVESEQSNTSEPLLLLPIGSPQQLSGKYEENTVELTWEENGQAAGYQVYSSLEPDGEFVKLSENMISERSIRIPMQQTRTGDTAIYYSVSAIDANGVESEKSAIVSVILPANAAEVPSGLSGIMAARNSTLLWESSSNAAGYNIYRSIDGAPYEKLNSNLLTSTEYRDTSLKLLNNRNHLSVNYTVTAVNALGMETTASQPVVLDLPTAWSSPSLSAVFEQDNAILTWANEYPDGIYLIERSIDLGINWDTVSQLNGDTNKFTDAIGSRTYEVSTVVQYRIYVVDPEGTTFEKSIATEITIPANTVNRPDNLKASVSANIVDLSWDSVVGTIGYRVYRKAQTGEQFELLTPAPITTNSYRDQSLSSVAQSQTYVYYVVASNRFGSNSIVSENVSVVLAPTVATHKIEDSEYGVLKYAGKWYPWNRSELSGAGANFSYAVNASVSLSFFGTQVDYVGYTNIWGGKVAVYLDGKYQSTIDTFSQTEQFNVVLFSAEVASGMHTIKLVRLSEHNPLSSGANIPLDYFAIDGYVIKRIEENHQNLIRTGMFTDLQDATDPDNKRTYTFDAKGSMTIPFSGTALDWYGFTSPWNGVVDVYLDGQLHSSIDTYAESNEYDKLFLSLKGLNPGIHYLKLVRTDVKNANSKGINLTVDYFLLDGEIAELVENDNPFLQYGLNWNTHVNPLHSGGTAVFTYSLGGSVETVFYGSDFAWYGFKSPYDGISNVYVDYVLIAQVDTYAPSNIYNQKLLEINNLGKGIHRIKITKPDKKNPSSLGNNLNVDYMITNGKFGQVLDHKDSSIVYTGDWRLSTDVKHWGGSSAFTWSTSASAEITFNGKGITVLGFKDSGGGIQKYYLDGVLVATSNNYSASRIYNTPLFEMLNLSSGVHTLRVVSGGTNPISGGVNISLDSVVIH